MAFVVAVCALGGLAVVRASPASRLLVIGVLFLSATVDLVGHVQLGPTTAYGWITGLVAVAAVLVALLAPARSLSPAARRVLGCMTLLPAWALLSVLWAPMSLASAQNVLVYVALPALVTVAALASASAVITFSALRRLMLATLVQVARSTLRRWQSTASAAARWSVRVLTPCSPPSESAGAWRLHGSATGRELKVALSAVVARLPEPFSNRVRCVARAADVRTARRSDYE